MKILVIDDYECIRSLLGTIFEKEHSVTTASDGEEGLKIFLQDKFDLVITDMTMPRMRGEELIRKIKLSNPKMKAILMSGDDPVEMEQVARAAGADYFVDKMSLLSGLKSAIKNLFPALLSG